MSTSYCTATKADLPEIREKLGALAKGGEVIFTIPGDQPFNRIASQRINGVAYRLWGKGSYRLRVAGSEISILRLADSEQGAGARPGLIAWPSHLFNPAGDAKCA